MRNAAKATQRPSERRHGVQAIARAAAVLRALEPVPEGLALGEIAAAAALPKSTAHRIVAALVEEDLVAQGPDGRIRLGGGAARLGAAGREAMAERLRPILLGLRRELDETVDLAVLDGASVRFVDQVPAPRRLRATSSVGEVFPLHCTANGKALLAALPEARALALLPRRLPRLTPHTITSRDELLAELADVRRTGTALDREEHTEGICAVGAAVSDGADSAAVAISVPVPAARFRGNESRFQSAVAGAAGAATDLLAPAAARPS
ncbi:MAG TPA: IclR family transcriptional regulator [Solirubrobacterales bacterium]|nr:IclR family transcriptional regulator [Solirubrobacterales bacterium]